MRACKRTELWVADTDAQRRAPAASAHERALAAAQQAAFPYRPSVATPSIRVRFRVRFRPQRAPTKARKKARIALRNRARAIKSCAFRLPYAAATAAAAASATARIRTTTCIFSNRKNAEQVKKRVKTIGPFPHCFLLFLGRKASLRSPLSPLSPLLSLPLSLSTSLSLSLSLSLLFLSA